MRWLGLALLGIAVAALVAFAASRLASQQIGLASEPVSAGDALAPSAVRDRARERPVRQGPGGESQRSERDETAPGKAPAGTTTSPPSQATGTTEATPGSPTTSPAATSPDDPGGSSEATAEGEEPADD